MFSKLRKRLDIPAAHEALPGRSEPVETADHHYVTGRGLNPPWPDGMATALFGLGCFWGAERLFWNLPGVWVTSVGYAGGHTPNPTYEEVCTGWTGHNEVVRVVYDPARISYRELLKAFFEAHDPTQGHRQGGDVGTQYRSGLYPFDAAQRAEAEAARAAYGAALAQRGLGPVTTEIVDAPAFWPAETWHQQYLAKNPGGYCGLGGTGVVCPIPGAGPAD